MKNQKMKEFLKGKRNFDINFYQSYISDLYSEINQKRDFIDLYGYLHRNVGYLGKSIARNMDDYSKFILPISWLFSLSNNINIKIQDAFIRKYPGICPYCLEKHCVCFKTGKTPLRPIPAYAMEEEMYFKREEIQNSRDLFNLNKAVSLINDIFSVNEVIWKIAGEHHHILKIHEEVAEIHEAYGNLKKGEEEKASDTDKLLGAVKDEVADVFAWILGAWSIKYPGKSLDDVFIDYYLDDCPVCKSMPCTCGLYNSRPATLIDFNKLKVIKGKLVELGTALPNYYEDISKLIKSYDNAITSHKATTAKVALSQSQEKLENIEQEASILEDGTEKSSSINEILDIINTTLKFEGYQHTKSINYDVFLSYSIANKDEARKIYELLIDNKIKVFMSEKEIKPSAKWENVIKEALKNSKLLCTLTSPDSLKSEWVVLEWNAAWYQDIPILPVLFRCSIKDLPEILKDYQAIDFHEINKIIDVVKNLSR